jgi:hypothetical protein
MLEAACSRRSSALFSATTNCELRDRWALLNASSPKLRRTDFGSGGSAAITLNHSGEKMPVELPLPIRSGLLLTAAYVWSRCMYNGQ